MKTESHVELEIGHQGMLVMIEPPVNPGLTRRVFNRLADGSLQWASLEDWRANNERARFYGFYSKELPASMTN